MLTPDPALMSLEAAACSLDGVPLIGRQQNLESSSRVIPFERRSKTRYPLQLPVSYRALDQAGPSREGKTGNLSSGGVWIISNHELNRGAQMEVRIQWPWLLEERIPLQLFVVGKVVRCALSGFAVLFRQYQFRTKGT